jgi:hypothetical protein
MSFKSGVLINSLKSPALNAVISPGSARSDGTPKIINPLITPQHNTIQILSCKISSHLTLPSHLLLCVLALWLAQEIRAFDFWCSVRSADQHAKPPLCLLTLFKRGISTKPHISEPDQGLIHLTQ